MPQACQGPTYLVENWNVGLPEDLVLAQPLAHLVQLPEELPDVSVVRIAALDVHQPLLVLVHVVVT